MGLSLKLVTRGAFSTDYLSLEVDRTSAKEMLVRVGYGKTQDGSLL
jgi:hypothetical protein